MDYSNIIKHYSSREVRQEIIEYCRERWIGLSCEERDSHGRNIIIRYRRGREPLKISSIDDLDRVFKMFSKYRPRTVYATIYRYYRLEDLRDIYLDSNMKRVEPVWDIDNTVDKLEASKRAVEIIVRELEKEGISSVYVKFSGNGFHVHLHERAISESICRRYGCLNIAYAIVEFIRMKIGFKLNEVKRKFESYQLKVENVIDRQRMFTAPLSLHREHDRVCVCIDPSEISDFSIEYSGIGKYRHWSKWKENFKDGEADKLAVKAVKRIGPYPRRYRPRLKREDVKELALKLIYGENY